MSTDENTGRNKEYNDINVGFAIDVILSALMLSSFPKFIRPWVIAPFYNHHQPDDRTG